MDYSLLLGIAPLSGNEEMLSTYKPGKKSRFVGALVACLLTVPTQIANERRLLVVAAQFMSQFQGTCGGLQVKLKDSDPLPHEESLGEDNTGGSEVDGEMCRPQRPSRPRNAVVFLGIIDILQPYSVNKKMETQVKAKASDAKDYSYSAISSVPPSAYAYVRFHFSRFGFTGDATAHRSHRCAAQDTFSPVH